MSSVHFEVTARDDSSAARTGRLVTAHGAFDTPAFAPVGTQGTVKATSPADLADLGVSLVMSNAYHLAMRPGAETIAALGGLHRLAGWDGPMMTDSGGYQVFSLEGSRQVDKDGVTFQSHVDGSSHRFTPESVVALQASLGADLVMPLDVCTSYPVARAQAAEEADLTRAWAVRAHDAHDRTDQLLYGIVQGSVFPDLRAACATSLVEIGFAGFAIGGVSVGEPKHDMLAALDASVPVLPASAPRHLLGVGHPEDIVEAVARGIDTFDCVAPTRFARNAGAMTMAGRLNLRNAAFSADDRPVEPGCACSTCARFSRGAIRHFVKAGEILGIHLLTVHNLHFVLTLTARIRAAILAGSFAQFRSAFLTAYAGGIHAAESGGTPTMETR